MPRQTELNIKTHVVITPAGSEKSIGIGRIVSRSGQDYKVSLSDGSIEIYGRWCLSRTPETIILDRKIAKIEADKIGNKRR